MRRWFVVIAAWLVLGACWGQDDVSIDAGGETSPLVDAPDSPACRGADGLPCLETGSASASARASLACAPTEPSPGVESPRRLRLVSLSSSRTPISDAPLEVWRNNVAGPPCVPPACVYVTSGADAVVTVALDDGFFAYRVPQNAAAMTYTTIGYNRTAAAFGETDVVAVRSDVFMWPCGIATCEVPPLDPADATVIGDVSDCDGEPMRGVTVRLFDSFGAEIETADTEPVEPHLMYRRDGLIPSMALTTTDYSGSFIATNVPISADRPIAVVAYGTSEMGGAREVIACEEIAIGANTFSVLSLGPYRGDYAAGTLCLAHTP